MSSWGQSRELTRESWAVLKQHRQLAAYPVLGVAAGLVPMVIFIPAVYFLATDQNWIGWALVVLGLYAATLVAAIFQAGLVVSAAAALDGGEVSFGKGIGALHRVQAHRPEH